MTTTKKETKTRKRSPYLSKVMRQESTKINELKKKVKDSIENDELLTQQLLEEQKQPLTFGEHLADKVASFWGSRKFICTFAVILIAWASINTFILVNKAFDPYPFILLNLILSCIAALQAPVIMMSQNRKEIIDRRRSENDYLINLKAEMQIRHLHEKIDLLMADQMKHMFKAQQKEIKLMQTIKKQNQKEISIIKKTSPKK